jgi:hypothetical protein
MTPGLATFIDRRTAPFSPAPRASHPNARTGHLHQRLGAQFSADHPAVYSVALPLALLDLWTTTFNGSVFRSSGSRGSSVWIVW